MDHVKEAFDKVKEDTNSLKQNIGDIKKELKEIQLSILRLIKLTSSTHKDETPTLRHISKTQKLTSTHNLSFQSLKAQNIQSSIGNQGVSTDRQTDRQTDKTHQNKPKMVQIPEQTTQNNDLDPSIILSQLDSLKKDIRLKIKRLTTQELLVFSSIYQFEDQGQIVDYSSLSTHINLSESSIRDYIQRIINKGMPIFKEKINNKRIILHISEDLKKLATLDTLLKLREL